MYLRAFVLYFAVTGAFGAKSLSKRATNAIAAAVLSKHNAYRILHGVPPLVLDSQISSVATEYAAHLAKTLTFQHQENNPYGENLFAASMPGRTDLEIAQRGVEAWYNEIQYYNFDVESVQSPALHFTQVVWKSSQKLGVGVVRASNGWVYMVCDYSPRGNYVGRFKANVPRPI